MATLHLIHGFIGAGKTTFAKKLELQNIKAINEFKGLYEPIPSKEEIILIKPF